MTDRRAVGLVVDEVEFPIEEGKLMEFARAVGGGDPGAVPLTFTAVAGHWREQAAMVELLELDLRRIVVGGSEWEYHAPCQVGDRLRGRRLLTGVEEKHGARGTLTVLTLETRFHRADGELAVVQRDTVIELPT
jgi:hydroxyacyl-ACP dehydratase HTD2-like protein with hotdog domain